MALTKRLRYEILRRDNHACRYCGAHAPDVEITVDHVVPVALGGSDEPSNLVAACRDCNAGKSASSADTSVVADVASDALRWADAMRQAAQLESAQREERGTLHGMVWDYWTARNNQWAYPPDGWEATVDQLSDAGLSYSDITEAINITCSAFGVTQRNRWRYFCGVCWRKLEQRQEVARALLSEPTPTERIGPPAAEFDYATQQYTNVSAVCDNPYWRP